VSDANKNIPIMLDEAVQEALKKAGWHSDAISFVVSSVIVSNGFLDLAQALIERGPDARIGESLVESAKHWVSKLGSR
jgi:hypothetical protein